MSDRIETTARGAAMVAHAGEIGFRTGGRRRRSSWLASFRAQARERRTQRARRAHALRAGAKGSRTIPGSEHSHLLPRGRGF